MASTLGCSISSFPQPYLGLPRSASKIRVSDLQPLIDSFDSYFAGWRGHLLNQGGREVLVHAVQSNFPIYAMCSLLLPKGVIDMIDAKRRAFLWTGEKTCSGGHCKAPWDLVCIPKDKGGLGVKDLHVQNHCLLQKFLSKLHQPASSPCQTWFQNNYGWNGARDLATPIGTTPPHGLLFFRALTTFAKLLLSSPAMDPTLPSGLTAGSTIVSWPTVSQPCSPIRRG